MVGRLVDTPEIKATSTGTEIMQYAVASDSGFGDNKKVSFFRVTSFVREGAQRDYLAQLEKGYVFISLVLDAVDGNGEGGGIGRREVTSGSRAGGGHWGLSAFMECASTDANTEL